MLHSIHLPIYAKETMSLCLRITSYSYVAKLYMLKSTQQFSLVLKENKIFLAHFYNGRTIFLFNAL